MSISKKLINIKATLPKNVSLVAVTKTKTINEIMEAYDSGHRLLGENKIQEMVAKWSALPKDIKWHMIGHIQRNKVKYMAPFVSLIHAVDSLKLIIEINKQALKNQRVIDCLLQIKIASEESKFGMSENDALILLATEDIKELQNIRIIGLMGMATFTNNSNQISKEFQNLKIFYDTLKETRHFTTLSIGMSDDYPIALVNGSTMVRVGSAIFGNRNYS
ncbi:MAG: YggS family pyridoxal phosphate-dependent enzyme [Bacteroidetes bacterium]|nr:YggS family pyridoxal phosphate-dependent enzyme [Bacteroidota bacterium]